MIIIGCDLHTRFQQGHSSRSLRDAHDRPWGDHILSGETR